MGEGEAKVGEIRKIIGDESFEMINQTQNPPTKYMLCKGGDLGQVTMKTKLLSKVPWSELGFLDAESRTDSKHRFHPFLTSERNQEPCD